MAHGRKEIWKITNTKEHTVTQREDIFDTVETFYRVHYKKQEEVITNTTQPKVTNQGSDDIPEITLLKIRRALSDMKNNKAPGKYEISIEGIGIGRQ